MPLVFHLPSGSGGTAAGMYKSSLMSKITAFAGCRGITFKEHTAGYKLKIWFGDESAYTQFLLTFNWQRLWRPPYWTDEPHPD